ncbi:LLM class flavin-dependent oxidoreductase [Oceanobacillus profundus]|uniref:LLM class flavin-dependent oxidoreductase n=1 Tax=Oceanobacillus profundus TaxID=372463 RepID=UPI000BA736C4|nr:LLM class flavin-dependent oxidoreductase [Oceanobacillus profundus]MBR3120487.1 LLM class flavin-dependent oxidoreductase [Oceanobacillus sp.]MCM3399154.1 LLM class flavin-dependent oxidoreductase [Oceanobacillus profundus]PAE29596.1 LLM class flavin-dependent oxidoreductase [Paenibacillus sp. 7884-2]
MKLSILDQAPIAKGHTAKEALDASIELAQLADRLGYKRYWVAEHHDLDGLASPAPDILLGIIGSQTERIRLGSGAVLLPNYKPYNVAERYHMLATLFPGRIDLGIGRAPGGSAEVSIALAGNFLEKVKNMPKLLDELLHFINCDFPEENMFAKIAATPIPESAPIPWLLGTSEKSAYLAAEKGLPYVFGHFMSDADGPAIVKSYFDNSTTNKAKAIVTVTVVCAESTEEAEKIAQSNLHWKVLQAKGEGKNGVPSIEEIEQYQYTNEEIQMIDKLKQNQIIGNPQHVKEELKNLQQRYDVDELMIVTITHSYEARKRSYELLAELF